MCVCAHVAAVACGDVQGIGSPGAGVGGDCELSVVSAGNRTQGHGKSWACLTTESSLICLRRGLATSAWP